MTGTSLNWDSDDLPRLVGKLTNDAGADLIGFGPDDLWTSANPGNASFAPAVRGPEAFGSNQGWSAARHVRVLADLTGDGLQDAVGFGDDGVWISLNNGDGSFAPPRYVLANFGYNQGWRVDRHPRFLADLTGDGKADIVGFGDAGVWVALNNGDGTFTEARFVIADLGYDHGWRVEKHPRFVADLTGDGRADLIGFGDAGVWTATSNGDGSFGAPRFVLANFGANQGWQVDRHARLVADLTGDGKADIIGFGDAGVWTALNNGDASFADARFVIADLGYDHGWRPASHPRLAADLTGDGRADIVAFGDDGVWTAVGNGDGSFAGCNLVLAGFNTKQGWQVGRHPRFAADLDGNGKADLLGCGDDGVWIALGDGAGGFAPAQFVLADFGARSAIRHRSIPLDVLQAKFDIFFNQRAMPLFQVKLDNPDREFGKSTVKVAFDENNGDAVHYDFDHPKFSIDLDGLDFSVGFTYNFYFQDLNTDGLKLNLVPGQPLGLEMKIHFETGGGIEIKVDGHTGHDIDITGLNITLRPDFSVRNQMIDLFGFSDDIEAAIAGAHVVNTGGGGFGGSGVKVTVNFRGEQIVQTGLSGPSVLGSIRKSLIERFISTDASVDVAIWPDGTVAGDLEDQFNSRIYDALHAGQDKATKKPFRDSLGEIVTAWLVGGPFKVVGLSSDGRSLDIDYLLDPGVLEPFPEQPQPPLDPGLLSNIDHIVVLMMENRSFDHMLGYLSLDPSAGGRGRTDVDGLKAAADVPNAYQGHDYLPYRITDPTYVHHTPPHEHLLVVGQIDGGRMDGFVREYGEEYTLDGADAQAVMSYYDAATLPVYDALAAEFLVCDRWFSAHPGPTFCNRFYTLTGRLNRDADGNPEFDNFSGADFRPVPTATLFDHLSDRGVPWRFYENRYCSLRLFSKYTFDETNVIDFNDPQRGFAAAAAAGTLPAVTFIDPNFIDEPDAGDNDDAAPGDVSRGQALIGGIVDALKSGPGWNKTMFIVTYDEHGGFFDHVNPMAQEFRTTAAPVSGIDFFGVRVPTLVVSPWVGRGQASHVVFDHTSIIKTISRRFMSANPPDMGERVAAANDLSAVMQASLRTDRPLVPTPAAPVRTVTGAPFLAPSPTSTEFKDVMAVLRQRYPLHGRRGPVRGRPIDPPVSKDPAPVDPVAPVKEITPAK